MAGQEADDVAERFDIAVVGAGPVGLVGALALASGGRRICLVGPPPDRRDGRTAALLSPSVDLLRSLGAWDALSDAAAPLRRLRIVDDTGSLFRPPPVEFQCEEIGLEAFGWNVENARLADRLAGLVEAQPAIHWQRHLLTGFDVPDAARLRLADGSEVRADLVVAADGKASRVRNDAAIDVDEKRYPQGAVTAIFRHSRPHRDTSTEFHKRGGPLTLVPMAADGGEGWRSSLVWVTHPHHAKRLAALDDQALCRAVEAASHRLLGTMALDGARGMVPLGLMRAKRFKGDRLALAGEAAHVLPPIGAQGLNLGFSDIAALRDLLGGVEDPGEPAILSRYDRERRADAGFRGLAVDGLNRSLLSSSPLVDAARGLGLGLASRIGPLRRALMKAGLPPQRSGAAG
jgi:2-octaprenyl-6-methoxyphenol hydroxylase